MEGCIWACGVHKQLHSVNRSISHKTTTHGWAVSSAGCFAGSAEDSERSRLRWLVGLMGLVRSVVKKR